ncbi:hypothetical protein FH972_025250 [Carpinus fangiana]|uniref:Amino acid transporter transmembrane domain-containing protein n=1 Tax=Carpinus fangiana TaxID=176857 RepID=A0A5N6L0H6_9ROSI|nr:hypothetical protein FH972_025250 [Carpinus fangiana]
MEPDAIGSKKMSFVSAHGNVPSRGPRVVHDSSITIEEYLYYAKRTREHEEVLRKTSVESPTTALSLMGRIKMSKSKREADFDRRTSVVGPDNVALQAIDEKGGLDTTNVGSPAVSDEEWRMAARAARTATWGAIFYLITTDILGPFSVPWAIAQMGYGPGFGLYTSFGIMAGVSEVIFMVCGFALGQIRTLQRFSYLANFAIWLNVFILFMTMGVASGSEPNWDAVLTSFKIEKGPIYHTAGIPPGKDLIDNINGLMQAVYSYGGATLFCELMAEMRRPHDFWKSLLVAEVFIYACYIIFGMVVYSLQGQGTYNPAYQGLNPYAWQTVGNVFALVSGLIAAVLYGNIGIKVLYANIGRELFNAPALEEKKGKLIWIALVPIYWAAAFIVGAAIPQLSYLSSFVGAATILQFTYTFPPILMFGFNIQKDAITESEVFDPSTGISRRQDSGIKRLLRGFMVQWYWNIFYLIYFFGALATAGLGIYSSVLAMHKNFSTTSITSFGCQNPAG